MRDRKARVGDTVVCPGRLSTGVRLGALAALLVLAAAAANSAGAARSPAGQVVVKRSQALATLTEPQEAMSEPSEAAAGVGLVEASRPITGERTVLPVLGRRTAAGGVKWLHVLLPGRPNGHTGWIRQRATTATSTPWHIVVDTATRHVTVFDRGRAVRTFEAIVGKPSTPTPLGRFFVEEAVRLTPEDVGAPFALALSARSDVLQEFDGGPGQIAFHGLANIGGAPGTAVSHGCVRLRAGAMRWLVARMGSGTPVTIAP